MYSDKVKDHFKNPRNVGKIESSNGMGEVGNPICGDMMTITIEVETSKVLNAVQKTMQGGDEQAWIEAAKRAAEGL